ncbi:MAG: Gfo/Idh/MocA family oxidoreductase [Clostridia bacterium]|nr:Gfo/Idh/MocA family oxidoreductase [Clostridia bacterium]
MDTRVCVAIIGCGRIAQNAHLPALTLMEDVRIKYVCDIIPEKAEAAVKKYDNVEIAITDYKVALADPEVDAVFVLTPNYAHYTVTMDSLRAGKHVMCEKPITVNYPLSVEMAEEARKQGKLLSIGVCNRYNRSVELLEEMNRKGEFGNIYHVYCSFRACRSIPGLGGDFTNKAQSGGGVLIDWGIHFLDLILYVLGGAKPKNVTCDAYCEMAKDMKSYKYKSMWAEDTKNVENGVNDVDDFVSGYIRTDKASISFNGAWAENIDEGNGMYIDFLGDKKGARLTYGGQFTVFDGQTLERIRTEHEIPGQHAAEDRGFIDAVRTGAKDRNYIDNILESMKLLDALYASSEAKKEVVL